MEACLAQFRTYTYPVKGPAVPHVRIKDTASYPRASRLSAARFVIASRQQQLHYVLTAVLMCTGFLALQDANDKHKSS